MARIDLTRALREAIAGFEADARVVGEVLVERARQDEKWGDQNHPDLHPSLTADDICLTLYDVLAHYGVPGADRAKEYVDACAGVGESNWIGIALEEFVEAVEAAALIDGGSHSVERLRTEVIQLAAVCVQWVQAIDRRRSR